MLDRVQLPPTVHHHAHHRVWQRGFYDFNVWTDRKIREKLDYMHPHPVERRPGHPVAQSARNQSSI